MEFHWLNKNLVIFEKNVKKILKYFTIVHIHGNNNNSLIENLNFPEVPEITFINKKHCNNLAYSKKFPVVNLDSTIIQNLMIYIFILIKYSIY